jgi:hypothetical protein
VATAAHAVNDPAALAVNEPGDDSDRRLEGAFGLGLAVTNAAESSPGTVSTRLR